MGSVPPDNIGALERLTEYYRAVRMPAPQWFIDLERRHETCHDRMSCTKCFSFMLKKAKRFICLIFVEGSDIEYKRLIETIS